MNEHVLNWEDLRAYCQKLLMAQGLPEEDAFVVADSLVNADLCGVESHGVMDLCQYLRHKS